MNKKRQKTTGKKKANQSKYDSAWKKVIEKLFKDFLEFFFSQPYCRFQYDTPRPLPAYAWWGHPSQEGNFKAIVAYLQGASQIHSPLERGGCSEVVLKISRGAAGVCLHRQQNSLTMHILLLP